MLASLAYVFLFGLLASYLCSLIRIPRIIGMLFVGILLGKSGFNLLDSSIMAVSAELRQIALIVILIKAGLSLNLKDLRKTGISALLLSFLPATFEIVGFVLLAPRVLGVTVSEAAVMGAVLGAVSPAVVVPRMIQLIEERRGTVKGIPQMILAGTSLDDVFVIVLFSVFVSFEQGAGFSVSLIAGIPVKIILGIVIGILSGFAASSLFNISFRSGKRIRNSVKVIIVLALSFLLVTVENRLEGIIPFSGLLATMSMACTIKNRCPEIVTDLLSRKFGRLWIAAELLLFTLVGALIEVDYALNAGTSILLMLAIGLLFRCIGVLISVMGTSLNLKEKLFCVVSYLPKATVQAAIGGIPLSLGLPCGELVLTTAVISILVTAPLGAFGIDFLSKRVLSVSNPDSNPHSNIPSALTTSTRKPH